MKVVCEFCGENTTNTIEEIRLAEPDRYYNKNERLVFYFKCGHSVEVEVRN